MKNLFHPHITPFFHTEYLAYVEPKCLQVRVIERVLIKHWAAKGLKPITHRLLPDYMMCVKDKPL